MKTEQNNLEQINKLTSLESELIAHTTPLLAQCRPNYDIAHTQGVVYWIKQLSQHNIEVDQQILLSAAYLHDIGYYAQFNSTANFSDIQTRKQDHMQAGAAIATSILYENGNFSTLTDEQKEKIIWLVSIHDKGETIQNSQDSEAQILLEADTLGALDNIHGAEPTFKGKQAIRYAETSILSRREKFKTDLGIHVKAI